VTPLRRQGIGRGWEGALLRAGAAPGFLDEEALLLAETGGACFPGFRGRLHGRLGFDADGRFVDAGNAFEKGGVR